jgi:urease accessory protein
MPSLPQLRANHRRFDSELALAGDLNGDQSDPVAETDFTERLLLWQLADSAFPIGGFAHSGGLEAAREHGELRNRNELKSFIESSLRQAARFSLPLVTAAHVKPNRIVELDRLCEAHTTNHVANRASRIQGQALIASAERIFPSTMLKNLRHGPEKPAFGHFAPILGVVTSALGVTLEATRELFIFMQLRGLISSAVRLNIAGPLESATIQHELRRAAADILEKSRGITLDQIAQTSPLLELWQGSHDRLYSRLFQS